MSETTQARSLLIAAITTGSLSLILLLVYFALRYRNSCKTRNRDAHIRNANRIRIPGEIETTDKPQQRYLDMRISPRPSTSTAGTSFVEYLSSPSMKPSDHTSVPAAVFERGNDHAHRYDLLDQYKGNHGRSMRSIKPIMKKHNSSNSRTIFLDRDHGIPINHEGKTHYGAGRFVKSVPTKLQKSSPTSTSHSRLVPHQDIRRDENRQGMMSLDNLSLRTGETTLVPSPTLNIKGDESIMIEENLVITYEEGLRKLGFEPVSRRVSISSNLKPPGSSSETGPDTERASVIVPSRSLSPSYATASTLTTLRNSESTSTSSSISDTETGRTSSSTSTDMSIPRISTAHIESSQRPQLKIITSLSPTSKKPKIPQEEKPIEVAGNLEFISDKDRLNVIDNQFEKTRGFGRIRSMAEGWIASFHSRNGSGFESDKDFDDDVEKGDVRRSYLNVHNN